MIRKGYRKVFFYTAMSLIGILIIVPFVWMISTSFKTREALRTIPIRWIPERPTFDAYIKIFTMSNFSFGNKVFNSFFLSIAQTFVSVMSAAMAAFVFAKISFRGRGKLFALFLATMMIPGTVTMVPNYMILKYLGLLDTFSGLIIPSVINAFGIFMLRQNMMSVNDAYIEAAVMDGSSLLRAFWKIMLPMVKPTMYTLVLFSFMGSWNSYLWPLIVLTSREKQTLQIWLGSMSTQFGSYEHYQMAGALISTIPIIIVYIFTQKYVEKGLDMGGLKL